MINTKEFLWSQKYRPAKIDDCILPELNKKSFKDIISAGEMQNLLLSGSAGVGKTTAALALCEEMGLDNYFLNASESGNIDTLRTELRNYAASLSLMTDKPKVIILDEFDNVTSAFMLGIRGFIEEFSVNCRFVLTCNYKNKILQPIQSRCSVIDFKIPNAEKPALAGKLLDRCKMILTAEKIQWKSDKVLAALINRFFPDFRRIINELQRYSSGGMIDEGILVNVSELKTGELFTKLKDKDFKSVRKWVVDNLDTDFAVVCRDIYDMAYDKVKPESIPKLVLILADYQYKVAFVADVEIHMMAMFTEMMCELEFK